MSAETKSSTLVALFDPAPGGPQSRRWTTVARFVPMVLAVAVTLYLELRARPSLSDLPWMPRRLVIFFDAHDFLKNAVAFGGLALTMHFAVLGWAREPWPRVAKRAAVLGAFVVALELAQIFLPLRCCDWRDMAAGWLGITLSSLAWARPVVRAESSHGR